MPCEAEEGAVGERNRATIVEIEPTGLTWRKSTSSAGSGDACVETAVVRASVLVRNSRDRHGARLTISTPAWVALVAAATADALDPTI